MRTRFYLHLFLCALIFTTACKNVTPTTVTVKADDHASRFKIVDCGSYKKIIVLNPWQESLANSFTYYLFDDNAIVPDTIPSDKVIRVPVKRIICMSTTHLAMIKELGVSDAIVGISGSNLVYDPALKEKIDKGEIPDVGYDSNLDKEMVVSQNPGLLMAYGVDPSSAGYLAKLNEMGIAVMYNADYLEETPLARAEWIRVFGALFNKEREADSIYNSLSINYGRICDSVISFTKSRPKVMFGGPWEDVWYVAPSNSYAIKLVRDGGGDYIYNDLTAPNSQPYPVESVFVKSLDADVWLNPGAARSLAELFNYDYRLEKLPVSATGEIYNSNKRLSADGGNDYWESAVIHPDVLLRDIVSILHPELYPGYDLKYYRKLR